jgi:hypothetical protein
MRSRFFGAALLGPACACAIIACAGKRGSSASSYYPCSLLTASEVSAAMGEKILQVQQIPPDTCRYLGENPVDFITVRAEATGGQATFEGSRLGASLIGISRRTQDADRAGIGDESYWAGLHQNVIWVRKGDAFFVINMATTPVDQHDVALKLAQIAITRL